MIAVRRGAFLPGVTESYIVIAELVQGMSVPWIVLWFLQYHCKLFVVHFFLTRKSLKYVNTLLLCFPGMTLAWKQQIVITNL